MESMVILVHVLTAIGITGLVLIQHGKGADMGASFGSGASATIFGSTGSGNALTKSTAWLATIFFVTSLVLALFAKQQASAGIQEESLIQNDDVLNEVPAAVQEDVPIVESVNSDVPQPAAEAPAEDALQATADQPAGDTQDVPADTATDDAPEEAAGDAQQ